MSPAVEFAKNYNKWIINKFEPFIGGDVLEIGTGRGKVKNNIKRYDRFVSLDIDEQCIANAQKNDPDGIYFKADISDKNSLKLFPEYKFRTVLCFNVLEHINEDKKALENMLHLLEENGYVLLFVPAFQSLYNSKDKLAGHIRRYTRKSLTEIIHVFENTEIVNLEYFNPIGAIGHLLNKLFKHKSLSNRSIGFQTRFFDKYLVSLSKALNPLTKNLFGQSIICILQKKTSK